MVSSNRRVLEKASNVLVYYEVIEGQFAGIEREKQIKKYSREKKNALIEQQNPNWEELKVE